MGNKIVSSILFLGFDASGKTTLIQFCANNFKPLQNIPPYKPTIGHEVTHITLSKENVKFTAWDVSGAEKYRSLWKKYFKKVDAVVWVVDSSQDDDHMESVEECMMQTMQDLDLKEAVLLVVANKKDLPKARPLKDITEQLGLNKKGLGKRTWNIVQTCATTGEGVLDGMKWLANEIRKVYKDKK